jgi:hypothetical protein
MSYETKMDSVESILPADEPGKWSVQPDLKDDTCPGCGRKMVDFHLCGTSLWVFYAGEWAVISMEELS